MIKIENADVNGFDIAARAMRNPMNSWDRSDSIFIGSMDITTSSDIANCDYPKYSKPYVEIGDNDLDLMKRLFHAGIEHRTYTRMISVSMDITAPLYWWKEMDRYTIGKTQISTSTMHKIHAKEFTMDDFSHDHLRPESKLQLQLQIDYLNHCRDKYLETKDKDWWWQMIQLLPSSYNQRRTVMMSYETVFKIIRERKDHKLDEWREFVKLLINLPWVHEIIGEE